MAESYKETSLRDVEAEYLGLDGKSFAVIVSASRSVQANHPGLLNAVTDRVNTRLHDHSNASGYIPTTDILSWLLNHPEWRSQPLGELAETLGVDRIILIEIEDYRLNEPGNRYEWSGVAEGTVAVIEADSPLPDEFAFERRVRVGFPDAKGFGPSDLSAVQVTSVLLSRFVDRSSWLFYDHKEPYYPDY